MKTSRLALLLVSSVLAGACGGGSGSSPPPPPPLAQNAPATGVLKSVTSTPNSPLACAALATEIKDMAGAQIRNAFATYTAPSYLSGGGVVVSGGGVGTAISSPATTPPTSTGSAPSATSTTSSADDTQARFSNTNIQSAGVDEPDWVKNDGQSLWTFESANSQLRLTQTSLLPASAMRKQAQIQWPQQLSTAGGDTWLTAEGLFRLSDGKVAAILGGGMPYAMYWGDVTLANVSATGAASTSNVSAAISPASTSPAFAPYPGINTMPAFTEIRVLEGRAGGFDALQSYKVSGRLIEARRLAANDVMMLVTEAPVIWPSGIRWYPEIPGHWTQGELAQRWPALLQATLDANLKLIADSTLEQWLGQSATLSTSECSGFVKVDAPNRLALTRIATIDPRAGTKKETVVLTEGSGVYANVSSLYLSTRRWNNFNGNPWQENSTDIHRFSISGAGDVAYEASGEFKGWLLNRFAMDETLQGGRPVLRVAASNRKVIAPNPSFATQPYSYLASFEQQGSTLKPIASSDPIAPGENLQSVRFVGDRAYVVTFRNIDPFFVFDLSDPARLIMKGELKVPGFSTYLHPISESLVFGLGVDSGAWPRRIKASLFNVANPAAPVEVATQILGDSNSFSEALWEPHALTFFEVGAGTGTASTLIAVPVGAQLKLLSVSAGDGMKTAGAISMTPDCCARRSVFVGETVYAISQERVLAARFAQPEVSVGSLLLGP